MKLTVGKTKKPKTGNQMSIYHLDHNSSIYRRLNSWQFKLSQKILGLRVHKCLSEQKASQICEMPVKQYKAIEDAIDLKASKKTYQYVYEKLKNYNSRKEKLNRKAKL